MSHFVVLVFMWECPRIWYDSMLEKKGHISKPHHRGRFFSRKNQQVAHHLALFKTQLVLNLKHFVSPFSFKGFLNACYDTSVDTLVTKVSQLTYQF